MQTKKKEFMKKNLSDYYHLALHNWPLYETEMFKVRCELLRKKIAF